jgi:hypothetical protein
VFILCIQQSERIPQHQREHDAYVAKALSFPLLPYDCVLNTASDDSKKHSETTATVETEHFNSLQTVADAGYYLSNYYSHAGVADVYNNALKMLNMDSKHFSHCGEQRLHSAVEHVKSSLLAADEQLSMYEKKICSAESAQVLNSWFVDQQTAAMQAHNALLQVSVILPLSLLTDTTTTTVIVYAIYTAMAAHCCVTAAATPTAAILCA